MALLQETEGLSIINPTPQKLPGSTLLHELIRKTSDNDTPAIDFLDGTGTRHTLSYTEFHSLSDTLAALISRELDALPPRTPGDQLIIPLVIPQSPELYIAILAILKAGGAFCPLNLDAPADRVKFILNDIRANLILTSSTVATILPPPTTSFKIINVDECAKAPTVRANGDVTYSPCTSADADLAYVMYTSGSTGTPKGVGISHLAATQSLLAHDRHVPNFSRFLQFAAPTFDVSVFEIFFPLFRGSTLVCCNRVDMLTDLPGVLRKMNVDACELTPSVAGSLLKNRHNAPNLQLLLTIGEMLTQPVVGEFGGDSQTLSMLWGMYGPTEAAIHCTLQPAFRKEGSTRCIGIPFDTVSAFVVKYTEDDAALRAFEVLPIGQIGELVLGGYQLANGYLNRPEQTASAFIDTEFGRVYKTGDKARMLPDGTLECLGRVVEGQIKLNGQRMELGEIEHAILRAAGCHSAFVCVLSNNLVGFAAVDDLAGAEERIMASCKAWLQPYMVPSEIIVMDAFPRLPSGKIDRMRLKEDYSSSQSSSSEGVPNYKDELERSLCEVASEVLHMRIGVSTKLAPAGLDSLSAIALTALLRSRVPSISAVDVLGATTISDLYDLFQERSTNLEDSGTLTNGHNANSTDFMELLEQDSTMRSKIQSIEAVAQCTALQTSMIAESLKDSRSYVNTIKIQFPPTAALPAIRSWFFELAKKNEILRTGFTHLSGNLVQVIWRQLLDSQVCIVEDFTTQGSPSTEQFLDRPLNVEIRGAKGQQPHARIIIHHALYDGWTIDLLLHDLTLLVQSHSIPERPQFRVIGEHLESVVSKEEQASAKEFWAEHLRGSIASSVPNFRTTAVLEPEIQTAYFDIPVSSETLRQLSLKWSFSPQAIFQGCLAWLWGAINGTEDITFGSVFSGRTLPIPDIERAMGPCLATFPLRVKLGESKTILDLIQSLHTTSRQILRLKPLQLTDIKRAATMPTSCRLFDVLFVYQESLLSRERTQECVKEISHKDSLETKLLLEVEPRTDSFSCQWTWHSDAFSESQIEVIAQHFAHLVEYFSQNLDNSLTSIRQSFSPESLSTYTSGLRPVETAPSIATVVENVAAAYPEADALYFAHSIDASSLRAESLTYKSLNQSGNQIARHLLASGVSPGGIVAIIMEKSPLLYCGILGILKAGCAYLPILPSTPMKRIHRILEQARPQLCIVDDSSSWVNAGLPCSITDLRVAGIRQQSESNLGTVQDPSQLAYVIFTSGTTGTPKGVSVTNKNLLSNIEVLSRIYLPDDGSRMLQACSQAFDVSVFEIFFTWANGMCLCAATNDTLFEDLAQSIRQMKVTHLSMTVTVASLLTPSEVPGVSFLVTSGEAMTDEVLKTWAKCLYQGYGPSETTNICTVRKVSKGDSSQYLGWSFENTSSFVLYPDSDEATPLGCLGELCFGGDQVASGYLNMPEMTALKFFEHPQHGRLYRSGDLGRMLPDGSLIILGRMDSQVKLRGQRIELQEIHALVLRTGIAKACSSILLNRQSSTSQALALCYVPASEESQKFAFLPPTPSLKEGSRALMQTLQDALPAYMIPTFIFPISSLPMTSSGKINNDHLRRYTEGLTEEVLGEYSLSDDVENESTEWTETERQIADILVQTLNVEKTLINRWSSFATIGLDSISAMPFARKLQETLQKRVTLSLVLQNPSIGRLAHTISSEGTPSVPTMTKNHVLFPPQLADSIRQRFTAQDKSVDDVLPCTPLQEAMLASSASSTDESSYCNQMVFRLRRAPDEVVAYWDEMCMRHEILRTCFVSTEDSDFPLAQVILRPRPFSWSRLETPDLERCALEHLGSLPNPINSFQPPLSLATISTPNQATYISFVCHHALYDGVAVRTLLSEIETLASGKELGVTPAFKSFLEETLSLPHDTDDFWRNHLQDFEPLHLQRERCELSNGINNQVAQVSARITSPLSTIDVRLREVGTSLLALCQASWAAILSSALATPDVCFGNIVSGRSVPLEDIDRLVAPCFNTIPIRIKVSEANSNRDLMKRCQQLDADMLPYHFTPLRKIHQLSRSTESHLFDTLLLLQPPSQPLNEDVWFLEWDRGSMDVPLVCEVVPSPQQDELTVTVHRDITLFSEATARLLLDMFLHSLSTSLQYPSSRPELAHQLPDHFQSSLQRIKPARAKQTDLLDVSSQSSDETWSERELKVRAVVAKLSRVPQDQIRKHTSIHRLGLDSISAIQVPYMLRQVGFYITAADVLQQPTCSGIASCLRSIDSNEVASESTYDIASFQLSVQTQVSAVNLPSKLETVLPCTPLQQGMVSQFILSEGNTYFNFVSWNLESAINLDKLANAWETLVAQHQILRTGFISVSHPDTAFAMAVYESGSLPVPLQHLAGRQAKHIDLQNWHLNCKKRALSNPALPPWQVVLVDDAGSKSMHLGMHHALYDAFSLRHLLLDLSLAVDGQRLSLPIPLETAVSSIFSHMSNQKPEAESFWRSRGPQIVVNSFPIMTPLRVDASPTLRVSRSSTVPSRSLRDNAANAGVTIQAALQSAWARVLSSYHGELSVTFGVVLSGRTSSPLDEALFPCITTLPVVAVNLDSNRELLHSMMEHNAVLRRYENVSLSQVQKWIGRPETAMFDTILVYQQAETEDINAQPWHISNETATVDYPVSLEIEEFPSDTFKFSLAFHEDILPSEQAKLLLAQFDAVFSHLLDCPDGHSDDLSLASSELFSLLPAERNELPSEAMLLHHFVEQSAINCPDSLALEFVDNLVDNIHCRRWTYKQLDQKGNQVAHLLIENAVKPGTIVAICFDKCPEAYFTILGILKAGCAFVALDPSAPASRQEFILQDSGAVALVVQGGVTHDLAFKSPVPVLEAELNILDSYPSEAARLGYEISPEDTCYCLYTSGTTGTPKGCLITHDNTVQAMLAFQQLFAGHWDITSRWLQFASFHFDVSVLEQYWSWSVGIPVISAPRDLILSDLISTISKLEITHIDLTPSLARLVHPDDVPSLCRGVFITGGEQLRQDILDVWGSKGVIYNAYGPTEATIGVTMYSRVPQNGRSTNIGKQFPNVGAYIFRPGTDVPVLKGGVGELCVSGKLVGKGYLNRPELTEERFPFLERFGERVYRTGDLVRVLHDGCFDFLGRADDQVKLRGQRLEVGEINHAIRVGVLQVLDVATLVTKHRGQDRDVMISFVVIDTSNNRGRELCILSDSKGLQVCMDAQDACRSSLPGYMVPTYIFCVSYIPLSANNKAQTGILKKLFNETTTDELRNLSTTTGGNTSLSKSEPQLARILEDITKVNTNDIYSTATIFELGFDSISVIQLARRLRNAGFPGATPSTILGNPQLSVLAKVLRSSSTSPDGNQMLRVKQVLLACYQRHLGTVCRTFGVAQADVDYITPCTPIQEGMLSRSATSDGQATYFNSFQLDLTAGVSVNRLHKSWKSTIDKHAILRTRFLQTSEGYIQVALKDPAFKWTNLQIDESEVRPCLAQRHEDWVRANETLLSHPLEIDCIEHSNKRILVIRVFHGIYDARSFDLILQHVLAVYNEIPPLTGPSFVEVLPLGPLCDFSSSRSFWQDLFADFAFQPMPSLVSHTGACDVVSSKTCDLGRLEERRISFGVAQQTIVQAAWISVLRQHFPVWPSMGIIVSGRALLLDGIENTIGPMFNTLPFRIKGASINSWTSLIQETHHFNATVLSFTHIPLRQIQKWCSNGQGLFDTLFAFDREDDSTDDPSNGLWTEIASSANADYPLAFEAVATKGNKLKVTIVAQPQIADQITLDGLLNDFESALASMESDDTLFLLHRQERKENELPNSIVNGTTPPTMSPSSPPSQEVKSFTWTDQALNIQSEFSALASVSSDEIGENTTLFELGLDSIDAVKLVARLRRMGITIKASELMRHPTIQGIISIASPNNATDTTSMSQSKQLDSQIHEVQEYLKGCGHSFDNTEEVLPPTPLQDSMVAEMVLSGFQHYFNHDVLEIRDETNIDELKLSLETVISNSAILRTCFVEVDDPRLNMAYCQVVANKTSPFHPTVSLRSLDDVDEIIEAARTRAIAAKAQSELLQLTFAQVSNRYYLVLSIAHALYDGASLDLFHQDVQAAYEARYQPRKPYKPILASIVASSSPAAEKFWADLLHGSHPTLLLPTREFSSDQKAVVHRVEAVSQVNLSDIKSFCKLHRVTVQAVGQACWAAILASRAKSLDVTFGVVLSGRGTEEEQHLMFPTMNTVPVRVILHGTTAEYLQYIWESLSNINEFQHFPLRKAQKLSGSTTGPLFNTLFTMQNSTSNTNASEEPIWKSVRSASEVDYPVCVEMEVVDDCLVWRVACDEQYISSEEAEDFPHQLDQVLAYLTRNSEDTQIIDFQPEADGVSICGLPHFSLVDTSQVSKTPVGDSDTNGHIYWSETESSIVDVLAEVSGVEKSAILPGQSIYHLGLDSISAIKTSSMLRKRGILVSVRDMVRAASIRDIASKAQGSTSDGSTVVSSTPQPQRALTGLDITALVASSGMDPGDVEKSLPALPMQVHMLSMWERTEGQLFFYEFCYKLTGSLTKDKVAKAWHRLVTEMPVLRTRFMATESFEVPFLQITKRPGPLPEEFQTTSTNEDSWSFKGSDSPFVFVHIFKTTEFVQMRLKIHHALYDGVSLPIIADRFRELLSSSPSPLELNESLWDDFVWRHYAEDIRIRRRQFWETYLKGATSDHLPQRQVTRDESSKTAEFRRAAMSNTEALKAAAVTHGVSQQALFFAAYAKLLSGSYQFPASTDRQSVLFGIYLANRVSYDEKLQDMAFPTLSIVPLRVTFEHGNSLVALAEQIQHDLKEIASFKNASVSLWEIHEWTGLRVDSFVNFLSLPGLPPAGLGETEVELEEWTSGSPLGNGDEIEGSAELARPTDKWMSDNRVRHSYLDAVDIEVAVRGESMDIGIFSSPSLLSQAQASDMIDHMVEILEGV